MAPGIDSTAPASQPLAVQELGSCRVERRQRIRELDRAGEVLLCARLVDHPPAPGEQRERLGTSILLGPLAEPVGVR